MYSYCSTTLTEVFLCFNTVIYVFLMLGLRILIVRLPWLRFLRAFSSVVRQMPGYNSPSRGTARTLPNFLFVLKFCVVLCIVLCHSVYKCVLYNCHRVATHWQLTNIYHITAGLFLRGQFNNRKHLSLLLSLCICFTSCKKGPTYIRPIKIPSILNVYNNTVFVTTWDWEGKHYCFECNVWSGENNPYF
jgi:hypothetical protein